MKKVLIGLMVILALGIVGCSSKDSNAINVMSANKAEKVVKSEYASRLKWASENISNFEEYHSKYSESKITEEIMYGAKRDRCKDYIEDISTFRTEDEEVNKLHDKLIETSLDVYNMLDEKIKLGQEWNTILEKDNETEADEKRIYEIDERQEMLSNMVENQEEHVENILLELGDVLGVN